jgi:predicted aldo/keto reductase-like oxidoreductase
MYFEHYGEQKFAMQRYNLVPGANRADRCEGCSAPCERTCPYGLKLRKRLTEAHAHLSMA